MNDSPYHTRHSGPRTQFGVNVALTIVLILAICGVALLMEGMLRTIDWIRGWL